MAVSTVYLCGMWLCSFSNHSIHPDGVKIDEDKNKILQNIVLYLLNFMINYYLCNQLFCGVIMWSFPDVI
nr:unnamed protein product [Callosobruchus chinensis]